ncbi:P-loop NTPase fold protein, partial [Frankia sp. AgKG'84/4]|uniref:P-loop NTPase fold protein n=1 Tax=Frankia sp. AgKG'84/4 TaxID=573490 RepID=UPI00202AA1DE
GNDGTVRIWNRDTGTEHTTLTGHTGTVLSVAVTPDGQQIISGSDDGTVRIWNRDTGTEHTTLTGHTGTVLSVAVTPDGSEIVSVGDRTIRVWNRRSGLQVRGTALAGATRRGVLAGVRSDEPSDHDLLEVEADVETLAMLIAASETVPPLAIAVLGEWGSGKSSVLRQLRARVDRLAGMSLSNPGSSSFVSSVGQIEFNAWHYSDGQVWTGIIEHLFTELATDRAAGTPSADPAGSRAERERLRAETVRLEAARTRLDAQISAVDAARSAHGRLAGLGSPGGFLRAGRAAILGLAIDVRTGMWALAGWAVLLAGAAGAWWWAGPWLRTAGTVLAGLLALAPVALARRIHRWMVSFTDRERRRLTAANDQVQQDLADTRARLARVDAAVALADVLDRLSTGSAYQNYRGLVGQISADLDQLERALTAARAQWQTTGSAAKPPPLERIILYVDDLDRCPPQRVVEVLTAVHLLLARRLFVVVVAVDAAWLRRSLTTHHSGLFGNADGTDAGRAVTPVDWLDKIFQIPFALRPMGTTAAAYLSALLPVPSQRAPRPTAPTPRPSPSDQPGPGTGPGPRGPAPAPSGRVRPPGADDPLGRFTDERLAGRQGTAIADLRPASLELTDGERTAIPLVGPLLMTPRAGKRLVNLYRLIRIGVPNADLTAFTAGPHHAALLLLAVTVGHPTLAPPLLNALAASTDDPDIVAFLRGKPCGDDHAPGCDIVADLVETIRGAGTAFHGDLATYRQWGPRIARHSFHTVGLVQPPRP